jgi:hypothetical protein
MRTAALLLIASAAWTQSHISPRIATSGASAYLIVFRDDADMSAARETLLRHGFDLLDHPDLRPNHLLAAGPQARLAELDHGNDVAAVLPAAHDLLARRRVHACAGAITGEGPAAPYVAVGRGWPRDATGAVALQYAFASFAASLDETTARAEIERALRAWAQYANLSFTASADPEAPRAITIRFAHGAHGDAYPFDGAGGMLAHTFYPAPPNSEPIAGDMHFDADEAWHAGLAVDFFTVALHEAGHALGLGHSDQPGAVMYPYYRQAYGLTSDDIVGIQDLYGARDVPPPTSSQPTITLPPATVPDPVTPPVTPPPPPPSTPSSDRTPPSIRITSPTTTVVSTSAATIAIAGSASDDIGLREVRWTTSTGDSGVASGTASWTATVPLYPGSTVVTVRAYDGAGNSSWRAITVTRR